MSKQGSPERLLIVGKTEFFWPLIILLLFGAQNGVFEDRGGSQNGNFAHTPPALVVHP
jgi:hypothetical protein